MSDAGERGFHACRPLRSLVTLRPAHGGARRLGEESAW